MHALLPKIKVTHQRLLLPLPFPLRLLPLISLTLVALLPLNLRHQPPKFLLVRQILLFLLPQLLPGNEVGVLAQLAHGALPLAPVLRPQLVEL